MKKLFVVIIVLCVTFGVFLYFYFKKSDYELTYELDEIKIIEEYNKETEVYKVKVIVDDSEFYYVTDDKYSNKRKLVHNVDVNEVDNGFCISVDSELSLYPMCLINGNYVDEKSINVSNEQPKVIDEVDGIKIYNYNDKSYLLWNYRGFNLVDEDDEKYIKLFDKDIYNLELNLAMDDYLLVADYNDSYKFDKFYVIDVDDEDVFEVELKTEIYFDSYFLGTYKDNAYIVDRKNKQEYAINVDRKRQNRVSGKIMKNREWEKVSITKLINEDYEFIDLVASSYRIEDNRLYRTHYDSDIKVLASNRKASEIVYEDQEGVYYLAEDKLYFYSPLKGEKLLMSYSEWQFNYRNMIFVFD